MSADFAHVAASKQQATADSQVAACRCVGTFHMTSVTSLNFALMGIHEITAYRYVG